ncbi:TIGR01459 family HAD-type hydrolase [Aliishimia ponticola]|uniref:TIGR01459 family HAD-type hydrolase n=1 Tax=Aliishimia ponticola TaxID=2499833 RepID=A0A4V3XKH6_9RHOB|nr:TIGR01459 family HAD-type hydrolase [Aliishimia ponticola]THH36993.1 TIGR01459 family HAD-type hydrolase [Aliishimia ponticola]
MTQIIERLEDISANYDVLLVDLWGCVHNGVTAFPDAVAALQGYRARGGTVALLTNAPRARGPVADQIARLNVPDDAWDTLVTSGDSARAAMFRGLVGKKVWFIGQDHDLTFFDPLSVIEDPVDITRVPMEEAEGIICTGPFDPLADPSEMRGAFLYAKQKGLEMICANPDIVVDRGETREWCAGALAELYKEMGGTAHYFGKPHPPIYDLAYRRIAELGKPVEKDRMLAIGDGALTDIPGAMGEGIDSLFISGGLAAAETRTEAQPDPDALGAYLSAQQIAPTYTIGLLR